MVQPQGVLDESRLDVPYKASFYNTPEHTGLRRTQEAAAVV